MKVIFAKQYNKPCVVPESGDTAEDVIERCINDGALCYDEGDEDCIVQLRKDVGPEVYSKSALRRTKSLSTTSTESSSGASGGAGERGDGK